MLIITLLGLWSQGVNTWADHERQERYSPWLEDYIWLASDEESMRKRKAYYQSLPDEEKKKIRKAQEKYKQLPREEQEMLRKRWEKTPEKEKNKYKKWQKERD